MLVRIVYPLMLIFVCGSILQSQPRVEVEVVEFVQAIQDINHSVPLISTKPGLLRVYLRPQMLDRTVRIRGEMIVYDLQTGRKLGHRSVNELELSPGTPEDLQSRREKLDGSLNFRVIPTTQGKATFTVTRLEDVSTGATVEIACTNCNEKSLTLTFSIQEQFRLRLLAIRHKKRSDGPEVVPTNNDFALITSWMARAYPLSPMLRVEVGSLTVDNTSPGQKWPFDCADINSLLLAVRNQDIDSQTSAAAMLAVARTHYYGVVADGGTVGGVMGGCSLTPPTVDLRWLVGSGPAGNPATVGWDGFDRDTSYADWYAGHEIGHMLGRNHPGACSTSDDPNYPYEGSRLADAEHKFVGFDTGDQAFAIAPAVLPGRVWTDNMDYCSPKWFSDYSYRALLQRIEEENRATLEPKLVISQISRIGGSRRRYVDSQKRGLINVIGWVDIVGGSGAIQRVSLLSGLQSSGDATSPVTLQLKDKDNKILASQTASLQRLSQPKQGTKGEGNQPDRHIFAIVLPAVSNAASVVLVLRGKTVDTYLLPPTLASAETAIRATPRRQRVRLSESGSDELLVEWLEVPGGRYTVQTSKDSGETWHTAALGVSTDRLIIDTTRNRPGDEIRVRVMLDNGLHRSIIGSASARLQKGTRHR